jgi:hypothetical protein
MNDRRREGRVPGRGVRARVRLGHRLVVVDVSARGALVEGQCPLRPGSRVEVQLESEARGSMVAARVTRCLVSAIDPECGVTYRAALSVADSCDWVREAATRTGYGVPEPIDPDATPIPRPEQ